MNVIIEIKINEQYGDCWNKLSNPRFNTVYINCISDIFGHQKIWFPVIKELNQVLIVFHYSNADFEYGLVDIKSNINRVYQNCNYVETMHFI